MSNVILHGFWRSGTTYRTRIALNLKRVEYKIKPINLRAGEHSQDLYRALQPQGLVPVLEVDGKVLIQSPAIIEWLEETYPDPALLPRTSLARSVVRAMAAAVGCDIHPLNNLRVLQALKADLSASQTQIEAWTHRWITAGFDALELLIERYGGKFCFGDTPSVADCYLIPQIYSAERFGIDLNPYASIRRVNASAEQLDAFQRARPEQQPDAPPAVV